MKLKKSLKIKLVVLLIISLSLIDVFLYIKYYDKKEASKDKVITEIKEYNYKLKDSKNELYKTEFKNLEKILKKEPVNYEEYAKSISKLFIIDFYSLNDKLTKNDIGGVEFVHSEIKDNFITKAENTFYKYIQNNLYNERKQSLPDVTSIKIKTITQDKFTIKKEEFECYKVTLSWKYQDNSFDSYQKEGELTLIKEDKKLAIVELK